MWSVGSDVRIDDARASLAALAAAGATGCPVLVDMRGMHSLARDARKEFAEQRVSSKAALLVESALSRTLANFFIRVNGPKAPTRMFTDETEALRWLRVAGV